MQLGISGKQKLALEIGNEIRFSVSYMCVGNTVKVTVLRMCGTHVCSFLFIFFQLRALYLAHSCCTLTHWYFVWELLLPNILIRFLFLKQNCECKQLNLCIITEYNVNVNEWKHESMTYARRERECDDGENERKIFNIFRLCKCCASMSKQCIKSKYDWTYGAAKKTTSTRWKLKGKC